MEIELKSKKKPVMERRIVLLKDFLKEEMSSCSSNGFKSFPRKTCCTYSIRHLVEMDLKSRDLTKNPSFPKNHHLLRNKSSSTTTTSTTISALQKASVAVINVVKYLTFSSSSSSSSKLSSISSPSSSSRKQGNSLSRSVSKKLKSTSFWRKNNSEKNNRKVEKEIIKDAGRVKDIMKWKSFRDLQKRSSSSLSIQTITTTTNTIYSWSPSSSDSECDTHHSREFKSFKHKKDADSDLHCSSSVSISTGISSSVCPPEIDDSDKLNQKCSTNQEIVEEEEEEEISIPKGDLRGEQSHQYGKVQQFNSPVSTLDFPSEEDEEESSSSSSSSLFQSSLGNMEKSKKKLMQKIRRFEGLGQLDPINLSKRIASFEAILSHDSLESPSDSYASSIFTSNSSHVISSVSEQQEEEEEEEEEDQMSKAEEKAKKLFQCTIKETARNEENNLKSVNSIEDLLLLDFFKDEVMERTTNERMVVSKSSEEKLDNELLRVAKNWMNGQCDPLDWGLQDSRKVHVREMEKGVQWRISNEDIVFEMEIMITGSLMDEVLAELFILS
ncbi:hypothetical protein C5167_048289 [Papaver somniferum]|uniref:DUF4378 domain-containing protein n=1 Tax=Papaver somniferum TaxID=3469 RepID=A0A4Y7KKB6_PAPSO|nr:uncharacterized protein DDB_G0271670-like [Papaver somniferum]RZC72812.1 hypothetical protein C5167_048289 [Papaver somniferum]